MIRIAPGVLKRLGTLLDRANDDTSPTRTASALLNAALDLIESTDDTLTLPPPIASLRVKLGHKSLHESDSQALQMVLTRLAQLEARVQVYDASRAAEDPSSYSTPKRPKRK